MSNTRHTNGSGSVPAIGAPPSAEVAGTGFAQVIGQTVAYHLAKLLGDLLPRMPWQPECEPCVIAAKTAIRAYEVLCANAVAAGEDTPPLPEPPLVAAAVTWQYSRPVCFEHAEVRGGQPVSAP